MEENFKKYNVIDSFCVGDPTEENHGFIFYIELEDLGLVCTDNQKQYEDAVLKGFVELMEVEEGEEEYGED